MKITVFIDYEHLESFDNGLTIITGGLALPTLTAWQKGLVTSAYQTHSAANSSSD